MTFISFHRACKTGLRDDALQLLLQSACKPLGGCGLPANQYVRVSLLKMRRQTCASVNHDRNSVAHEHLEHWSDVAVRKVHIANGGFHISGGEQLQSLRHRSCRTNWISACFLDRRSDVQADNRLVLHDQDLSLLQFRHVSPAPRTGRLGDLHEHLPFSTGGPNFLSLNVRERLKNFAGRSAERLACDLRQARLPRGHDGPQEAQRRPLLRRFARRAERPIHLDARLR